MKISETKKDLHDPLTAWSKGILGTRPVLPNHKLNLC